MAYQLKQLAILNPEETRAVPVVEKSLGLSSIHKLDKGMIDLDKSDEVLVLDLLEDKIDAPETGYAIIGDGLIQEKNFYLNDGSTWRATIAKLNSKLASAQEKYKAALDERNFKLNADEKVDATNKKYFSALLKIEMEQ